MPDFNSNSPHDLYHIIKNLSDIQMPDFHCIFSDDVNHIIKNPSDIPMPDFHSISSDHVIKKSSYSRFSFSSLQ